MKKPSKLTTIIAAIVIFSTIGTVLAISEQRSITVTYNNIKLVVDGVEVTPKDVNGNIVEPFAYDGTTYVPIRAISEALGKDVEWDAENAAVLITTPVGVADTTPPTLSVGQASPEKVYVGGTVTVKISFSDNVGVEKVVLDASTISLVGFTADISASGEGNTRMVTLSNIQGSIGTGKYITVESGAVKDLAGNSNYARNSGQFEISK